MKNSLRREDKTAPPYYGSAADIATAAAVDFLRVCERYGFNPATVLELGSGVLRSVRVKRPRLPASDLGT